MTVGYDDSTINIVLVLLLLLLLLFTSLSVCGYVFVVMCGV